MGQPVRYGWEISEEGCFKMALLRLPKAIYKDEESRWLPISYLMHEDHWIHKYDKDPKGRFWSLKPEYL